jgi:hypothetical protein
VNNDRLKSSRASSARGAESLTDDHEIRIAVGLPAFIYGAEEELDARLQA